MKKKKWNRVLAVLLMMVMSISLLSGCGGKSTEKEDAETITVYYGAQACMKNTHLISRNSSRISMLNLS